MPFCTPGSPNRSSQLLSPVAATPVRTNRGAPWCPSTMRYPLGLKLPLTPVRSVPSARRIDATLRCGSRDAAAAWPPSLLPGAAVTDAPAGVVTSQAAARIAPRTATTAFAAILMRLTGAGTRSIRGASRPAFPLL